MNREYYFGFGIRVNYRSKISTKMTWLKNKYKFSVNGCRDNYAWTLHFAEIYNSLMFKLIGDTLETWSCS